VRQVCQFATDKNMNNRSFVRRLTLPHFHVNDSAKVTHAVPGESSYSYAFIESHYQSYAYCFMWIIWMNLLLRT